MALISTLSDAESLELGVDPIVDASDPDNPTVTALGNIPQTDRQGRPVISLKQKEELHANGARLDQYALRMYLPHLPNKGPWLIQASKYLKWFGKGYRSVSDRKPQPKPMRVLHSAEDEVTIYRCADKYADCKRFFDTQKGLESHWRTEHGEMNKARARVVASAEKAAEAVSAEE